MQIIIFFFFVCFQERKNNTGIIETQAPNFWVCPTKCKTAGHPTQVYDAASLSFWAVDLYWNTTAAVSQNSYSANRSASHTVKWRTLRKACLLNSARDVTARRKMKYTSALRMKSSVIMAQILHLSSWPLEPPCLKVFLIFFQHVVALKTAAVTHALQYLHQPNLTEEITHFREWL